MNWPVTYVRKVRFSDTDLQGVVFNGNYLTYFDDVLTDYFEAIGLGWATFTDLGFDLVVAHVDIDFRSSARLGEQLVTGARVQRIGTTSLTFSLETREEEKGRLVVEGSEVYVIVDPVTFHPAPVPEVLIEAVERLQGPLEN